MKEDEILTESVITSNLRERCFNFLKKNNIQLPIEVSNSLSDVFDENDFTSDEEDVLNFYFKEDLDAFQQETMIYNVLNIQTKGGNSSGDAFVKITYYGTLSTATSYSEDIALYDGEENVHQYSLIEPTTANKLEDPDDYCIVFIEEHEFHMGIYTVTPRLYMYLPMSGENI